VVDPAGVTSTFFFSFFDGHLGGGGDGQAESVFLPFLARTYGRGADFVVFFPPSGERTVCDKNKANFRSFFCGGLLFGDGLSFFFSADRMEE